MMQATKHATASQASFFKITTVKIIVEMAECLPTNATMEIL